MKKTEVGTSSFWKKQATQENMILKNNIALGQSPRRIVAIQTRLLA